jgi:drug/metabolite transporter (DMT)-like permease
VRALLGPVAALMVIGAAWGATQPLAKVAVSQGHAPLGLLVWQSAIVALLLGSVTLIRGRRIPCDRASLGLYLVIALAGSVLPGIASYSAAVHLPSGILSILLSSIPMLALPMAIAMGNDRFSAGRLAGLVLGLCGVALLVLPETSLPEGTEALWIPVALVSSAFYAFEGNYVARWGTRGLDPLQVLTGASVMGLAITLPLALASGQYIDPTGPWRAPEQALVASAVLHASAYAGYVGLVGIAGAVFTAQVSYFVTFFGLVWAMLFLSEAYSGWVWAALGCMLAGLVLVQPRPKAALVPDAALGQNGPVKG